MVVLDRADWLAWLDLTRPAGELLRPLPAGLAGDRTGAVKR
jgi:putative SOS response-associated peptidase YedK